MRTLCIFALVSLLQISCGAHDSATDAGIDAGTEKPECLQGGIEMLGRMQSDDIKLDYTFGHQVLTADPDIWILYPDDGGRIRFELQNHPDMGTPVKAVVTVTLGTIDGPDLGNCRSDGFSSSLTLWENRAVFDIENMYASPFCGGEPVDGRLSGCASW